MKSQVFTVPPRELLPCPFPAAHDQPEPGHCPVGCADGACETCPCCGAGWCVYGIDGLPEEPDDLSMWLDVAADHNPLVAAVRAVLDVHDSIDAVQYAGSRQIPRRVCTGCGTDAGNWQVWPCPTVRAITTALKARPAAEEADR